MTSAWMLTIVATLSLAAQDETGFTGAWKKNLEQSDDAEDKMKAAMEQMRGQMDGQRGGGGGRPSGGGRPGGGGGSPSGRPGGGGGRGQRDGSPGAGLLSAANQLELELTDGELHIDDGERLTIFYLDGEKHLREMGDGAKIETTAELRGSAVVIEESMERGESSRKLEISPDGRTMVVTVTLKSGRVKDPVVIRSVYERDLGEEGG